MANEIAVLIMSLPPLLLALTIHEFCHGYAALKMGDPTAKYAGRLTFNPIKHIDWFGFLAFLLFRFGWAKPVPVDPRNFYNYRKGILITSLAGPLSNFLLAVPFGLVLRLLPDITAVKFLYPLAVMLQLGLLYNLILCAFNLIPVPPLDGSKVLFSLLPTSFAPVELWLERYGVIILLGLIFFDRITGVPVLWGWIGPFVAFFGRLFAGTSGMF
ncbi:MAG TPA: site-2 protease family protein [bacterium]